LVPRPSAASLLGDLALHLAEQRLGGIAAPPVLLRRQLGRLAPPFPTVTMADFAGAGASPFLGAAARTTTGTGVFFRGGRF
jgi:hypothetical protein